MNSLVNLMTRRRLEKETELSIVDLLQKKLFLLPEGRSSEIAKYAAATGTDCEKIVRVHSTMYRAEE